MVFHECKKCLLYESGEVDVFKTVTDYLKTIDEAEKADDTVYQKRLGYCKECEFLISGMCRKCGCYVEIRAALNENNCPNFDNRKW